MSVSEGSKLKMCVRSSDDNDCASGDVSTTLSSTEFLAELPEFERSESVAFVRLLPGDPRPVPTTSGMESDLGRRTLSETSPKESADSSGLGIVHDHEGGVW